MNSVSKSKETLNMKSKRAIILPNALSLIIAVIGLTILFFGTYKLYSISQNQEDKNAQNFIDNLKEKIDAIPGETNASITLRGFGKNWYLTSWGKDESLKPDKCFFISCICACKGNPLGAINSCQDQGFCREMNQEKIATINPTLTIEYKETGGRESTARPTGKFNEEIKKTIYTSDNLIKLEIIKTKDTLTITHYSEHYLANFQNIINTSEQ